MDVTFGPGRGFSTHPHRGVAVVTWVVSGTLRHRDDLGNDVLLPAGTAAVLRAGGRVHHSEVNAGDGDVRFVQSEVPYDGPSSYEVVTPVDGVITTVGGLTCRVVAGYALAWA